MDYQKLFIDHLDLVDRVIRYTARKHHLSPADVDEFSSVVRLKLIDRDFAVLRKFQGRSALATYLTTVIDRFFLDFQITSWGKWRPSTAARRLGPVAVLLEQLVMRDGMTLDEAARTLQTNHGCTATREELHAMLVKLPERPVRRLSSEKELAVVASTAGRRDVDPVEREHDEELARRIEAALVRAVATLPPRDQLMLKLRFVEDVSIAHIARLLNESEKVLYRRFTALNTRLHTALREEGIGPEDVTRVVGHPCITLSPVLLTGGREDASV